MTAYEHKVQLTGLSGVSWRQRLRRFYDPVSRPGDGAVIATVGGLFSLLGRKWRVLLAFAFTGLVLGFVISWMFVPRYIAEMILVPNVEEQLGSLANISSNLGSLSSLVSGGGLMKPENVTPFQRFRAVMETKDVAVEMEDRGRFLERLFPERWDAEHHAWKSPSDDLFTKAKASVKMLLRLPVYPHPVPEDLIEIIHKKVSIGEDEKQSVYTLSFAAKDPKLAKEFLSSLYVSIESVLLRHERVTADMRVQAALKQIDQTTLASERQSLQNVLTLFQMKAIQVDVGSPYGARILSGPTVPDQPNDPNVPLFMGAGFLIGLVLAGSLILAFGLSVAQDFSDREGAVFGSVSGRITRP